MKRLNHIFKQDKKTVIVAMDHGMGLPVNPALDDTENILKAIVRGGADALLTTYGIAKRYGDILQDVALIVRLDGGNSCLGPGCEPELLFKVEDAIKVGADAVACMGFPGSAGEEKSLKNLAKITTAAHEWGFPVMAEMLPGGFSGKVPWSVDNLVLSARTGCEYGADIIKTSYTGTAEEYARIIKASYAPVVILGGAKSKDLSGLFTCVEEACSVGASGVAIGRNVWNHESPEKVVKALVDLVHHGAKASEIRL